MNKQTILDIIKIRLKEHIQDSISIEKEIKILQENQKNKPPNIEYASKIMINKDRLIFNKACKILLEDLQKEIERL